MRYIEGVDYWVRRCAFPCVTIYAWAVSLGDGTFDIWLNSRVSEEKQLAGLRHDLKHLEDNHFYRDDLTLAEKKRIAWGTAEETHENEAGKSASDVRVLPGKERQFFLFRSNSLPQGADFAFYVPDNTLNPYFQKGSLVCCDGQQLQPGDIGLFGYQGNVLCRQYYKDRFGITYLFVLDRQRYREDITIPVGREVDLTCYGRIQVKRRPALPQTKLLSAL